MFSNRIGEIVRRAAGSIMVAGVLIGVPALGVTVLAEASRGGTPTNIHTFGATCYDEGAGPGYTC